MPPTLENPFTPKSALPKKRLFGGEEKQPKRKKEMAKKIKNKVELARIEKVFSAEIYQDKINSLKETGVIKQLENGQWGIVDILGKERPVPSYEEVKARIEAKSELLARKIEQGFTELLLVPIGAPLSFLIDRTRDLIVKKHKKGKLLGTDGTKLDLNEEQPVYIDDIYKDADVKGDLVYYPQKFDQQNHGGKTKAELLEGWLASRSSESVGWQILLIENLPDLPAKANEDESNVKVIKGRKQLGADLSPREYLEIIQTGPEYANEQFTTPEAQLIYFLEYLQRNNQVIDDWQGQGKICWNVGAYFKGKGAVPSTYWVRFNQRFRLAWDGPAFHHADNAARASVKF